MTRIVRLALPIITISFALAQNYLSRGYSSHGSLSPRIPRVCSHPDLKVTAGEGNAAMGGVREMPFIITNVSASACTLEGYPALDLLTAKGVVIKHATKQKSDEPLAAATIEPGKTAWFNLNYNAGGAGQMGKPCPAYPKVKITVPGVTQPFVLRADIQTCPRTDFTITVITPGEPQ